MRRAVLVATLAITATASAYGPPAQTPPNGEVDVTVECMGDIQCLERQVEFLRWAANTQGGYTAWWYRDSALNLATVHRTRGSLRTCRALLRKERRTRVARVWEAK